MRKQISSPIQNKEVVRETQMRIAKSAGELISERGFHATSMRDISKATGINLSYIYSFINSKDDILYLYYSMLQEEWSALYEEIFANKEGNPVDQIKTFLNKGIDHTTEFRKEIRTLYTESRHLKKESLEPILDNERSMVSILEGVIKRGIKGGYFQVDDSFLAANCIQYMLVMHAMRGWNLKIKYSNEKYKQLITKLILRSLNFDQKKYKTSRIKSKQSVARIE